MNNAGVSPEEALFRKHIYYGELDYVIGAHAVHFGASKQINDAFSIK